MAEYNIDNLSQEEILYLISSKFSIKEIEGLKGLALCASNVSSYFYHEIACNGKRADFCNSCLFSRNARPKLLDLLRDREKLNTEEEERGGGGILIKSNSKASSISNILKRIKI